VPSASAVCSTLLVKLGFKEIEVGFPRRFADGFSISCARLIEGDLVPKDVTIQVLTQSRSELIRRTFDAICGGSRRAIVHLYKLDPPSCSAASCSGRIVPGIIDNRGDGCQADSAIWRPQCPTLKSSTNTRPRASPVPSSIFALEICEAVLEIWGATHPRKRRS